MTLTIDDATKRIREMGKRPEMWAYTIESFMMQIGCWMEVGGLDRKTVHAWLSKTGQKFVNQLLEQITPDIAKPMCASALQALEPIWAS